MDFLPFSCFFLIFLKKHACDLINRVLECRNADDFIERLSALQINLKNGKLVFTAIKPVIKWLDTALVGGWFESIANAMPFAHAVNAARFAVSGDYAEIMTELLWVIVYAVALLALAISAFTIKMKRNK